MHAITYSKLDTEKVALIDLFGMKCILKMKQVRSTTGREEPGREGRNFSPRRPYRDTLLDLRKMLKCEKCSLIKVESHLEFLKKCEESNLIPSGLNINIKCHAYKAGNITLPERLDAIISQAEKDLLLAHYSQLRDKLQDRADDMEYYIMDAYDMVRNHDKRHYDVIMSKMHVRKAITLNQRKRNKLCKLDQQSEGERRPP